MSVSQLWQQVCDMVQIKISRRYSQYKSIKSDASSSASKNNCLGVIVDQFWKSNKLLENNFIVSFSKVVRPKVILRCLVTIHWKSVISRKI